MKLFIGRRSTAYAVCPGEPGSSLPSLSNALIMVPCDDNGSVLIVSFELN